MIGQTISYYRVLGVLGSGGMGIVYRAVDERLGRDVALKFLPAEVAASHEALERFRREARLASTLNHPGICIVHDVDEHEGRPFIVMELVEGSSLGSRLGDGPLPVARAIAVAIEMLDALGAAHARGIIHRDIKPANVFITPHGHVKVLDFGLAKLTRDRPASDDITEPGLQVGTLAYMSPEQARGEHLDLRTDLFAAGAVLYEMLTGQRAFAGASLAVVSDQVLNRQPPRPRTIRPEIPPALDAIVMRALEKPRERRYESAGEMAAALREVLTELEAPAAAAAVDLGDSVASSRRGWLVAALVVLTLGIGLAFPVLTMLNGRGATLTDRDSIIVAAFANTTGEEVFDDALGEALTVQLAQSPFLDVVPASRVTETLRLMNLTGDERVTGDLAREVCVRANVRAMLQPSIARLGELYIVTLEARECRTGEMLAAEQARADRREDVLQALGAVTTRVRSRLGEVPQRQFDVPIEQATTGSLDALQAYTLGRAQRARGAEMESIPFFRRALELDPEFAAAHTMLSTVYGSLGEWVRSEEHARLAYARRERISERERLLVTYQYHDRVTGDQLEAARTLEVWKQTYPRDFVPANARALLFVRLGMFGRAVEEAREALARQPDHPFPLSNLAYALRGLGRLDEARQTAQRAVDLRVETAPTRRLLYQLDLLEGRMDSAEQHLQWASGRPREFDLLSARAQWLAYHGRMGEARATYQQVIAMAERRGLREAAAGVSAHLALTEALYGNLSAARSLVSGSLGVEEVSSATVPRFRALTALALAGAGSSAARVVAEMAQRYPRSTLVTGVMAPSVRGAMALASGGDAIAPLRDAMDYELGTVAALVPVYLRAWAYLEAGEAAEAREEFERILAHRGTEPFSPVCALARLGLARADALAGRHTEALAAYDEFFALWSAADEHVPILQAARREAAALRRRGTS